MVNAVLNQDDIDDGREKIAELVLSYVIKLLSFELTKDTYNTNSTRG